MNLYLATLLFVLVFFPLFGSTIELPVGISPKNLLLYPLSAWLVIRGILGQEQLVAQKTIILCFSSLVIMAAASIVVVVYLGYLPAYSVNEALASLKSRLLDPFAALCVFYYALTSKVEALRILQFLLVCLGLVFVLTVIEASGLEGLTISTIRVRDGTARLQGPFGDPNEFGSLAAIMLPSMVAFAIHGSLFRRIAFWTFSVAAGIVILVTVSRTAVTAAFFGLFACAIVAPQIKFVRIGASAMAVCIIVISMAAIVVSPEVLSNMADRFDISGSTATTISSGRTAIWLEGLKIIAHNPFSLVSGFGWNAYESMNLRYDFHNHYLKILFNLGVVGLGLTVTIFITVAGQLKLGLTNAAGQSVSVLIGLLTGWLTLLFVLLLIEMYTTWPVIAAAAGLGLRIASTDERASLQATARLMQRRLIRSEIGFGR